MALLKPAAPTTMLPETQAPTLVAEPETVAVAAAETLAPLNTPEPSYTPDTVSSQQVAQVAEASTAVAVAASSNHLSLQDFAAAGFAGLTVDSRTFPIINLKNDGHFKDMDDFDYGSEMRGNPLSSSEKLVVTAKYPDPYKPEQFLEDVVFSMDGIHTTTGRPLGEWREEMVARKATFDERKYTDILVALNAPGEDYDGEMRIWSIAPSSRGRLTGVINILAMKQGWRTPLEMQAKMSDHVLVASVGPQVKGGKGDFYPWAFKFA